MGAWHCTALMAVRAECSRKRPWEGKGYKNQKETGRACMQTSLYVAWQRGTRSSGEFIGHQRTLNLWAGLFPFQKSGYLYDMGLVVPYGRAQSENEKEKDM